MSDKRGNLDEGLNSLMSSGENKGFRQLIPPFRRRSNPEKIKSGTDTILTFQDKTYVLQNLPGLPDASRREVKKASKSKAKLKPLTVINEKNFKPDKNKLIQRPTSLHDNDQSIPEDLIVNCLEETIMEEDQPTTPQSLKMDLTTETEEEQKEEEEVKGEEELEFGGPVGVMVNMITMPLTIYLVTAACDKEACTVTMIPRLPTSLSAYLDPRAALFYVLWIGVQVLLHLAIPGRIVAGAPLANKTTVCYICNGFQVFLITTICFVSISLISPSLALFLTEHSFGIITSASVVSVMLSVSVYMRSFTVKPEALSVQGNTGVALYDFYMGRELNPHLGALDLKFFCELRPGLLLWGVIDMSYIVQQWQLRGHVEFELVAVVFCHMLYIGDALFFEDTVLTTLDITSEGFGFMLAFGNLTWVPFLFSLHARFLAYHPQEHSILFTLLVLTVNVMGYYVFRVSNNEKDKLRRHPSLCKALRTLDTPKGSTLLVDGWWRWLRHPNYFGDFIMGFSWTMFCGFRHFVPFLYFVYLSLALLHRTKRDDKKCAQKYREVWLKYKRIVPYCMLPYVY